MTNSYHFLHDLSTMAAAFASGLDLLLLPAQGPPPAACPPLCLPQAQESDCGLELCSLTQLSSLSFHPLSGLVDHSLL